jgi:putative phosphoribosyl transferase
MNQYMNRQHAGIELAKQLASYANQPNVIVLGLPRGGVPVAYEVAHALKAPLDIFIVRKLGVPVHKELAMGAIALGNAQVLNERIIHAYGIDEQTLQNVIQEEQQEMRRREKKYRGNRPFPDLKNKTVILVDDGIATGATMFAAIKALKQLKTKRIVVAVPVADRTMANQFAAQVDEFVCPLLTNNLQAVGLWYNDFSQTEDEEVQALLKRANQSYV